MAAITLSTVHQAAHIRETAQNRSRRSPRNARCLCQQPDATGCSRGRAGAGQVITFYKRTMIAMLMTSPDVLRRQAPGCSTAAIEQGDECSGILPPGESATVTAQFQPLDPGVVSEAIPAFFIGRNKEGRAAAEAGHVRVWQFRPRHDSPPVIKYIIFIFSGPCDRMGQPRLAVI
jgi:hypothetical protein